MIAYVVQYLIGVIVGPVVGALVAAWTGEHLISAIAGIFAGVIASSKALLESYKVVQEIRLNERKLREADRIIVNATADDIRKYGVRYVEIEGTLSSALEREQHHIRAKTFIVSDSEEQPPRGASSA